MTIRLNPAVRIIPPSNVTGRRWVAENILERRRYVISGAAAAALAAAARPGTEQSLTSRLAEIERAAGSGEGPSPAWEQLVASLRARRLLLAESEIAEDPDLRWLTGLRSSWSRFGWHEAAEYHALCFDYPCVDYSEAVAILTDRDRMRNYQSSEPDDDRFKLDHVHRPGTDLPAPGAGLSEATARAVWGTPAAPADLDVAALSRIVSLTFGVTGTIVPKTDAAPLLRRSSPSGGGRNPSEGYLVVRDVPGLEAGWYHVTMSPFSLRRLEGPPVDDVALKRLFPNTVQRFPRYARALLVLTTVFERNMYRYREPRTFRTVHMDIGHLAGTVRIAARAEGLTAAVFYCDAATEIEQALGIDGMAEGYMLTVALADGNRGEELVIPRRPVDRSRPTAPTGEARP